MCKRTLKTKVTGGVMSWLEERGPWLRSVKRIGRREVNETRFKIKTTWEVLRSWREDN